MPNADFDSTCQPCVGDYEKYDTCEIDACESEILSTSLTYKHHHCCEDSSAFRVRYYKIAEWKVKVEKKFDKRFQIFV